MVTQTIYNDAFNRPTLVKSALGVSGVESHAAMYYAPVTTPFGIILTNNDVLTATDQATPDDSVLRSWTKTDGFGRAVEAWSKDPQGDVKVATIYDALGRAQQVSNPYRPSLGETPNYTTTAYDLAGRVTTVTTPDSAIVATSYSGNTVTITDQAGKQRQSVSDALGRLIQVYEAPNDWNYNYLTSYNYDTLNNLITVNQGTQTRSFVYDSLKRLTSASNPESSTISYVYDDNGNLTQKTDARGVVANYAYDALNRNTSLTYVNDPSGTLPVTRVYDLAPNGKGRLYQSQTTGTAGSLTTIDAYDALGRPLTQRQQFDVSGAWSQSYTTQGSYNLAGGVTSQTYPSGRTVSYSYDSAGRTSSLAGNLGDGTQRTYATGIIYSSLGGMTKEQFGTDTPVYNKLAYNSRGQLSEVRASTSPNDTDWNRGKFVNWYSPLCGGASCNNSDNNGNLRKQETFIPHNDQVSSSTSWSQQFEYDQLNRLTWIKEFNSSSAQLWQQEYVYDRWGNRTIHQSNTWGTGIPKPNFGVDVANNRLTVPGGYTMSYDAAGNVLNDTYTGQGQRTYDAENRMKQAWANGQWQTYSYDGDGRRVKRNVNGVETWQVYGMGGELLAEYAQNGSPTSPQKEYGYRNGQLLITATVTTGWGAPPTLDDNPLNPPNQPKTDVKAIHITQLRAAINALRSHYSLGDYPWQKPAASGGAINNSVLISWEPIDEMRTAIDQALDPPSNGYTSGLGFNQPILAAHIQELRNRVLDAWQNGGGVDIRWLVSDHLGTPRMAFDQTGSLANMSRHDYLPFGEELFAGTGGRSIALGYSGDSVRQKFTRKERDIETGLDYFLARYYSSTQGRFTSPDEFTGGPDELYYFAEDAAENPTFYADLTNPQSLNKYQYTYNNPINLTDDDGHCPICKIIIDHYSGRVERAAQRNPEVALDVTQAVVSVVGIVPGAGEVADVANAGISIARGNKAEAALDLAGALGPVGSVAATGNRIRKIAKAASKADDLVDATKVVKKADNAADAAKATPPKREHSVEGTQVTRDNIKHAQKVHRKAGRPERIRSTKKSDQNLDNALRKIKSVKDVENQ